MGGTGCLRLPKYVLAPRCRALDRPSSLPMRMEPVTFDGIFPFTPTPVAVRTVMDGNQSSAAVNERGFRNPRAVGAERRARRHVIITWSDVVEIRHLDADKGGRELFN